MNMCRFLCAVVFGGLVLTAGPRPAPAGRQSGEALLEQARKHFSPLPRAFETPDNPLTPAKTGLGKVLFYETRISADGTISCFKCHWTNLYFTDGLKTSMGMKCRPTPRNAPTVLNAAGEISEHWIGNRKDVEDQARRALTTAYGWASPAEAETAIRAIPEYTGLFKSAFPGEPDPVTAVNFGKAVGAFERTLATPNAFDGFLSGNVEELPGPGQAGLAAFMETGCAGCHNGATVGGRMYAKFGVTEDYWKLTGSPTHDQGRFAVTRDQADMYVFKVPPLRNVEMTAPYFHDGSVARLPDAVRIMARVQLGKTLDDARTGRLISFLHALTGPVPPEALAVPLAPASR